MKRKFLVVIASISFILGTFTGCNNNNSEESKTQPTKAIQENEPTTQGEPTTQNEPTKELEATQTVQPTKEAEKEKVNVTYKRVSVHDPSVIKADGTYYIFGSHMAFAKSEDLMSWTTFQTNINKEYNNLFGNIWEEYCKTENNPNLNGNLWAPDVIYNETMKKYCMYMSVNGNDWNSVIVLLTADQIEGPYEYVGPIVYSGFNTTSHPAEKTDVYRVLGEGADLTRYQSINNTKINAIDPSVKFDENGDLWMVYGSWFGGLYMLKLEKDTGLRDYSTTYTTESNVSDAYYGYKIAGGNAVSGEGPYIMKVGDYYYLFVSYGGLTAEGGYQMRVYRSKEITGPYADQNGNSAIYKNNTNNLFSDIGIRLMSSYKFSANFETHVAQGHNSAFVDEDGKIFLVYHTRFANGKNGIAEAHEVRVHQMFINEDDWLVVAPHEYSGETISKTGYSMEEMIGEYELIIHNPKTYYQKAGNTVIGIIEPKTIVLEENGTVSGNIQGTWSYQQGTASMSLTMDGVTYKGIFLKQATEGFHELVTTFTALGENVCVWGSKK